MAPHGPPGDVKDEEKLAALRRKEQEDEENVSEDVRKLREDMAIRLKKRQEQKQLFDYL